MKFYIATAMAVIFFFPNASAGGKSSTVAIPRQFQGDWVYNPKSCMIVDPGSGYTITSVSFCVEDGCSTLRKVIASDQYRFSGYFSDDDDRKSIEKILLKLDKGKLFIGDGDRGGGLYRCK